MAKPPKMTIQQHVKALESALDRVNEELWDAVEEIREKHDRLAARVELTERLATALVDAGHIRPEFVRTAFADLMAGRPEDEIADARATLDRILRRAGRGDQDH